MNYIEKFEHEWAEYCDMKYGVSCTNGTSAILLSLGALGIGPGDEVVTTAFTFEGTATPILMLGGTPIFEDISEDYLCHDEGQTIGVHLFGKRLKGEWEIEDCAQAHGIKPNGLLNTFSFYRTKNLPIGEGGMVVTDDRELADEIRKLRSHGKAGNFYFGNLRMCELQAYEGLIQLKNLDLYNNTRKEMARFYDRELSDKIIKPDFVEDHVWHQYVVRVDENKRDEIADNLNLKVHYRETVPHKLNIPGGSFSVAEKLCKTVLSLPIGPDVGQNRCDEVVNTLNREF